MIDVHRNERPPLSKMISSRATVYMRFPRTAFTRQSTLSLPFLQKRFCRATAETASGVRPRDEWPGFLHKGRARPGDAGRCSSARTTVSELIRTAALTFCRAWEKSGRPIFRLDNDNRRSRPKFSSHAACNGIPEKSRMSDSCRSQADYLTNLIKVLRYFLQLLAFDVLQESIYMYSILL